MIRSDFSVFSTKEYNYSSQPSSICQWSNSSDGRAPDQIFRRLKHFSLLCCILFFQTLGAIDQSMELTNENVCKGLQILGWGSSRMKTITKEKVMEMTPQLVEHLTTDFVEGGGFSNPCLICCISPFQVHNIHLIH